MAAGEAVGLLEVERASAPGGPRPAARSRARTPRAVRSTRSPSSSRRVGPRPLAQRVGRVLHVAGHHVLPGGRQRRVDQRRDRDVQVRPPRDAAVLRVVERALEVVHVGADVDPAAQQVGRQRAAEGRQRRTARGSPSRPSPSAGSCACAAASSGSSTAGSSRRRNVRCGSALETTARAAISSPPRRTTPVTRAVADAIALDLGAGADLRAAARAPRRQRLGQRAQAARHLHRRCRRRCRRAAAACSSRFAVVPADHGPGEASRDAARAHDRAQQRPSRTTRPRSRPPPSAPSAAAAARPRGPGRGSPSPSPASGSRSPLTRPVDVGRRQRQHAAEQRARSRRASGGTPGSARRPRARRRASRTAVRAGIAPERDRRPVQQRREDAAAPAR